MSIWSGIVRALIYEYTLDMREGVHPEYLDIKASCSCGNIILIRSTLKEDINLEVCSACHPFYTGKQKLVDTGGRVERFEKRFGKKAVANQVVKSEEVKEASLKENTKAQIKEDPFEETAEKKKTTSPKDQVKETVKKAPKKTTSPKDQVKETVKKAPKKTAEKKKTKISK